MGLILAVIIHSAGIIDRNSAELVFEKAKDKYPRLKKIFLDAGYQGQAWQEDVSKRYGWDLDVVRKLLKPFSWFITAQDVGLAPVSKRTPLKWRWIVEYTFAWFTRWRRLSKDYVYLISNSTNLIYAIMLRIMSSRLARQGIPSREVRYPIKP